MPGITYRAYLAQMERSFNENLSDRLLEEVESLKPSDNTIDSMLKSLETQFEALLQIDAQMRTILNFPNQITQ